MECELCGQVCFVFKKQCVKWILIKKNIYINYNGGILIYLTKKNIF